jgi:hypothetical protein
MSLTPILRVIVRQLLPAGLLAIVLMTSSTPAQSLGDVARQEQARRKSAPSGKVYTNGDLKGAPAPAASSPSTPGPSSSTPSNAPATPRTAPDADAKSAPRTDAKTDDKGGTGDAKSGDAGDKAKAAPADPAQDEADWRKRQKTIQDSLDRARTFAEALQSRINGLTAEFAAKDDPAQRTLVGTERQKAITELDRVKQEIQQHTQELSDLQEEARRAGVPPGWLR